MNRLAQKRVWDPASGRLGNVKVVNIEANGCAVRIISGSENKIIGPMDSLTIQSDGKENPELASTLNVTLKMKPSPGQNRPCAVLQISTADYILIRGDGASILFDRVRVPALRVSLNPSSHLQVWFDQPHVGHLTVNSNAFAIAGGNGKAEFLSLASSQSSSKLFFHSMDADHVGVSTTVSGAKFSIRIRTGTDASYYQPARAAGDIALQYPIWIDGNVKELKVPAGRVTPLQVSKEIETETDKLRQEIINRVGLQPEIAANIAAQQTPSAILKLSPRQQVADAFAAYLPSGVSLNDIQMYNNGGALEGQAQTKKAVTDFVAALGQSPDVIYAQIAYTRPQAPGFFFRVLFDLLCASPEKTLVCKSKNNSYDLSLIRSRLLELLGNDVQMTDLKIKGDRLSLVGSAREAQAKSALERIGRDAAWLQISTTGIGKDGFSAVMNLKCLSPEPRKLRGLCK